MCTCVQPMFSNRSLKEIEDLCRRIGNYEIPIPSADKDGYIDELKRSISSSYF